MLHLTTDTFARPADPHDTSDPRVLYVRSYLLIRTAVGTLGALLPTVLFLIDWAFLRGDATVRGSLSAYYFTPARDLFVGVLCTAGILLVTYLAGQVRTWDFWLSSLAGVAALGVAFFPNRAPRDRSGRRLLRAGRGPPSAGLHRAPAGVGRDHGGGDPLRERGGVHRGPGGDLLRLRAP